MESFRVNLSPIQKQNKFQPYYFYILGFLYLGAGFLHLFGREYSDNFGYFWIGSGLVFLFVNYYQQNYQSKYYFELNDDYIEFKYSVSSAKKILISNIDIINFRPISIILQLNGNIKEEILLANVGYKNVLDIKEKLRELAISKNITFE